MALRVIIVEHEPLRRRGIEQAIAGASGMLVAGAVDSVTAAEQLSARVSADVILVDSELPDMDGMSGVALLLTHFPNAQVVVLGAVGEPGQVIAALRAGADGYLIRTITPEGLVQALVGMSRGEAPIPRGLVRLVIEAVRHTSVHPFEGGGLELLSAREHDVVAELAAGLSNAEIARRLGVSESTVKSHVSNILRKTGSRSRFMVSDLRKTSLNGKSPTPTTSTPFDVT